MRYQRDFIIGCREARNFSFRLSLHAWGKGFVGFGVVGALAAWLYWEVFVIPGGTGVQLLAAAGTGLLVVATATLSLFVTTTRRVNRDFRRAGQSSYVQRTQIDGFGVRVSAQGRQAKVGFDKLLRVEETKSAFYLYLAASQAWILPKAQMEDPASESAALRQIFSTVIESKRLKLKKN